MNITFIRGTILLIFFLLRCTVVGLEVVRDAFGLGRKLSASVIWEDLSHQGVLMLLDIKSWCLLCNAHTLIIPAVCHFECFVICIFSSITRNFQIFIRVRNAGASGRECSALAGRHYLPPRQASFTSFFNKEIKLQLSGRRAWIPSSLLSVWPGQLPYGKNLWSRLPIVRKPRFSTLRIISS